MFTYMSELHIQHVCTGNIDVINNIFCVCDLFQRPFKITLTVTNCEIGGKLTIFEPTAELKDVFRSSTGQ